MANLRHPAENKPNTPEGEGHGGEEAGVAELEMDEIGWKQGDEATDLLPHRRRDQRQERHEATRSGAETEVEA